MQRVLASLRLKQLCSKLRSETMQIQDPIDVTAEVVEQPEQQDLDNLTDRFVLDLMLASYKNPELTVDKAAGVTKTLKDVIALSPNPKVLLNLLKLSKKSPSAELLLKDKLVTPFQLYLIQRAQEVRNAAASAADPDPAPVAVSPAPVAS